MRSKVTMSGKEFKAEHKRLPKLLVSGTLAQRKAEANKQKNELMKYEAKEMKGAKQKKHEKKENRKVEKVEHKKKK